uniref:NADH-ubiquinone oxidoreductase chain 4L n=1 Tax=Diddensiella santjacobensis TaxID=2704139 RepID=S5U403_9ASCO|nr:NADH dehydrogenase subunit 4L [Diddensiella santjacobensis]AGS44138.1 NADH dehydrogenase subunit 4L [Diddensiella santjacobensis]
MLLSYTIFSIGLLGFVSTRKSIILLFMTIEIMLLGITLYLLVLASYHDDITGILWAIVLLIIAGAESAIGLSILVCYYRLVGNIEIFTKE